MKILKGYRRVRSGRLKFRDMRVQGDRWVSVHRDFAGCGIPPYAMIIRPVKPPTVWKRLEKFLRKVARSWPQ